MWSCTLVTLAFALGRLRQGNYEFEASLKHTGRPHNKEPTELEEAAGFVPQGHRESTPVILTSLIGSSRVENLCETTGEGRLENLSRKMAATGSHTKGGGVGA